MLRLSSPAIEVVLDPDHGAEILEVRRPGGPNVLATYDWESPVWASRSTTYGADELDWLSEYRGAWQELFPNAGPPCTVEGVPLPFHGEASRARWTVVRASATEVVVRTPARLPLVLERRMWVGAEAPVLRIEETVHAESALTVPFLWGHHPAFVATEGAAIDMPPGVRATADPAGTPPDGWGDLLAGAAAPWPELPGIGGAPVRLDRVPAGPIQRLAFIDRFPDPAWAAIRGIAPGLGVAMAWDRAAFPAVWNWWEIGGPGHPWHGRARIVAIEPATAWPSDGLAAAAADGRAHTVAPGRPMSAWLTMALFAADERPVTGVDREGGVRVG